MVVDVDVEVVVVGQKKMNARKGIKTQRPIRRPAVLYMVRRR